MPRKLTPKGENTRQQIISTAYQTFLENGYNASPIRDIARRAGLTIGGVYTHFPGKEDIFIAVLEEYHPFIHVFAAINQAQGGSVDELVRDAARRMLAALGTHRAALNLLFIEIVEFQAVHVAQLVSKYFPQFLEFTARIIQMDGGLRPIHPEILGRSFFGLLFSYFMTLIALSPIFETDQHTLDRFIDIYLYGILAGEPSAQHPGPTIPRAAVQSAALPSQPTTGDDQ